MWSGLGLGLRWIHARGFARLPDGYPLISGKKYPVNREYVRLFWAGTPITFEYPANRRVPGYPGHYLSSSSVLKVCYKVATTNKLLSVVVAQKVQDSPYQLAISMLFPHTRKTDFAIQEHRRYVCVCGFKVQRGEARGMRQHVSF